ncbi:aquaporin [Blastococcus sp. MG754426]|uniref:MIP/aquaporin family protein n=1 Tax=unclassified Blastococcus TaxID=2619396 RepID=UPI001EEFF0A0|nr:MULTISPECIES: aquaporin [unclassified Blastococcus]MCF6506983.1 aquaporin [Blastococcus sp. MG754426]MCF6510988.1 aquaporin [Blastococcus sp. MG754427]MCF6734390.1 aquaporin [Blastococcus sp. KM273129]
MSPVLVRSLVAEFLGTALLVLVAVGTAVVGLESVGPVGVALAFGFTLLVLAYAIGPVSGCHVNPAVTLAVLLSRGMTAVEAALYWVAQFAGGITGAAVLWLLTSDFGGVTDQTGALGANDWGAAISGEGAFLLELLLTFVLVVVVLLVTGTAAAPGFAGLAIGLTLAAVHLIGIPLTGTSVNPARSLGPALLAGGEPLAGVWLFVLAPVVGAVLAVPVARLLARPAPAAEPLGAPVDETGAELPGADPGAAPGGDGPLPISRTSATGAGQPGDRRPTS